MLAPKNPKNLKVQKILKKKCLCSPILEMRPLNRGLHNLQKRVFRDITNRHTDTKTARRTWRLYERIGPVGWFDEREKIYYKYLFISLWNKSKWLPAVSTGQRLGCISTGICCLQCRCTGPLSGCARLSDGSTKSTGNLEFLYCVATFALFHKKQTLWWKI